MNENEQKIQEAIFQLLREVFTALLAYHVKKDLKGMDLLTTVTGLVKKECNDVVASFINETEKKEKEDERS